MRHPALAALLIALAPAATAHAQAPAQAVGSSQYSYADLVALADAAPIVADVAVADMMRVKPADATDVRPGYGRFYIVADVQSLLRGAQGLPGQISFLVDIPLIANRAPKLKKQRFFILANAVPNRPAMLRLTGPDAMIGWSAAMDSRLRAVLTALNTPGSPPRITGIDHAFHVPGSLPGESETQIFLATADGRPVSLNILRRPGEQPFWAVALGEIVDAAARPPEPDTLLWYRLACSLPREMPFEAISELPPSAAVATRRDYALVLAALGPCTRHVTAAHPY